MKFFHDSQNRGFCVVTEGFLSLEEIMQFGISDTESGHFTPGDISSKDKSQKTSFLRQ